MEAANERLENAEVLISDVTITSTGSTADESQHTKCNEGTVFERFAWNN
jgi:hypothetical protein